MSTNPAEQDLGTFRKQLLNNKTTMIRLAALPDELSRARAVLGMAQSCGMSITEEQALAEVRSFTGGDDLPTGDTTIILEGLDLTEDQIRDLIG